MNKIFLAIIAVLLLASSAYALDPVAAQIEIRHANLERIHAQLMYTAEGMLDYIKSIGGETTTLESLYNDFVGEKDKLLGLNDHVSLNKEMQTAGTILQNFVNEYDTRLKAKAGNGLAGLGKALENLKAHQSDVDALNAKYWTIYEKNSLELFDYYVEQGETFVSWYEKNGYDTTQLQATLDKITAKKPSLEAALQSKQEIKVNTVLVEIGVLVQQLGTQADQLLKQGK